MNSCSITSCQRGRVRNSLCYEHYRDRCATRSLRLQEVDLSSEEMEQIGKVVEALAARAVSFVWEPLTRGEFRDD